MRFRWGLAIGFGTGYFLGTKAGRERYAQLQSVVGAVRRIGPLSKIHAVVEIGLERFRPDEIVIDSEPYVPAESRASSLN
jgi:hypothetical protein